MPMLDISADATGWSLVPVAGGEEELYLLTFLSGVLEVQMDIGPGELAGIAAAIEAEAGGAEATDIPWAPEPALTGPMLLRIRLAYAGVQAHATGWAKETAVPYWELILDDLDGSQAMLSLRAADVGALLFRIRGILGGGEQDPWAPVPEPLPDQAAVRLLAMIGEARRNRDGATDPAGFFADWAARHRDAGSGTRPQVPDPRLTGGDDADGG